jgi:hypothetical protein
MPCHVVVADPHVSGSAVKTARRFDRIGYLEMFGSTDQK